MCIFMRSRRRCILTNKLPLAGFLLAMLFLPEAAFAQGNPPQSLPFSENSFLSSREFIMAISVLVFGIAMTAIATYLLKVARIPTGDVLRILALLVIVTGVLFLVAAGYDAQEVAPAIGLLGTIAGYLLGRSDREDTKESVEKVDEGSADPNLPDRKDDEDEKSK